MRRGRTEWLSTGGTSRGSLLKSPTIPSRKCKVFWGDKVNSEITLMFYPSHILKLGKMSNPFVLSLFNL